MALGRSLSCRPTTSAALVRSLATILCAVSAVAVIAAQDDPYLRISFIDVGQGDAIWIQAPDEEDGTRGANVIIDGGPDRGEANRLVKYLEQQSYGLEPGDTIDCVLITHPHNDHYPGLLDVLAKYEVRRIIDSGYPKPRTTKSGRPSDFAKFRQAVLDERADGRRSSFVELVSDSITTPQCGNVDLQIIYAYAKGVRGMGAGNTQENNASTVVKLTFGAFSFLFMGDAEGQERDAGGAESHYVEQALLAKARTQPDLLRATVLKAGHHGSDTGSTLPFLQAVNPEVVVVMSGRKDFGRKGTSVFLPDPAVLQRYQKTRPEVTILRTDDNDARERRTAGNDADGDDIYMYSDGETLRVHKAVRTAGGRRWQLVRVLRGPTQ